MEKDEMLEKIRKDNKDRDPMRMQVELQGRSIGMSIGMVVGAIAVLLTAIFNEADMRVVTGVVATYESMVAASWLYRGIKLKDKGETIIGIFTTLATVTLFVLFIIYTVKK